MEETVDSLKTQCSNCQADLTVSMRFRTIIFRYCPKCGFDNNKDQYLLPDPLNPWILRLILPAIVIFPLGDVFFGHGRPGQKLGAIMASVILGLIVLISVIYAKAAYKTCNFCVNGWCKPSDTYCGNCGKPWRATR
jgi:hypothetical protein